MTKNENLLDADVSELISIVVHDLKTPVTATRGFLDLVENTGPVNAQQTKWLQRAYGSLDRMERLITTLLDWARLEAGQPLELVVVDLRGLMKEAYDLIRDMAEQRDITIEMALGDEPIMVAVDEQLMSHVFGNLLSNAIKYNEDGGKVTVAVVQHDSTIHVKVTDTGIGIEPKDHERVFERFYRASRKGGDGRKVEGTGLGLAISRVVVEMHGGEIWLESTPGEGSTFAFSIPLDASPAPTQLRADGRSFGLNQAPMSGEIIDDVDDDLQERPENPERESKRDEL